MVDQSDLRCILVTARGDGSFEYNGKTVMYDELPIGAMWNAPWKRRKGPDGRSLYVMLPGQCAWFIDGRANNCTKPQDTDHQCWVRHGEPPDITVDKNGITCDAGAGSVIVPGWHGFLEKGYLTVSRKSRPNS